eukprot:UN04095
MGFLQPPALNHSAIGGGIRSSKDNNNNSHNNNNNKDNNNKDNNNNNKIDRDSNNQQDEYTDFILPHQGRHNLGGLQEHIVGQCVDSIHLNINVDEKNNLEYYNNNNNPHQISSRVVQQQQQQFSNLQPQIPTKQNVYRNNTIQYYRKHFWYRQQWAKLQNRVMYTMLTRKYQYTHINNNNNNDSNNNH